jgi:hypothetical protein
MARLGLWRVGLPVLATTCLVAITLAVFAIRLAATMSRGAYTDAACEGPCVYNIWKVQHGYPLYEWFDREPYNVTYYNWAFYQTYARVLQALGVECEGIILGARLLTLLCGLIGSLVTYRLAAALTEPDRWTPAVRWLTACYSVFLWLGSASTSWFALCVRPDLPSFVLALTGLLAYAITWQRRPWAGCLAASLLFYLAWAFKQSTVGILVGTCLHALLCGRPRSAVLALALPCAALMGITLWAGGEVYRFNLLQIPRVAFLDLRGQAQYPVQSLLTNTFVWVFPLICLFLTARASRVAPGMPGLSAYLGSRMAIVAFPSATAVAWCLFAVFHTGASKHTLLEGYLCLGTASLVLLINRLGRQEAPAGAREPALVALGILAMAAFPLAQLAFPDRLGNLTVASGKEHEGTATFVAYLHRLPKPLLVEDGFFALPWHATDNTYPSYVPDVNTYMAAKARDWITDGGLEKLVRRHAFPCLLLKRDLVSPQAAREAGYQPAAFPPGVDSLGFQLFRLPDATLPGEDTRARP